MKIKKIKKEKDVVVDYCIYGDTDSLFVAALPLLEHRYPNQKLGDTVTSQYILDIVSEIQDYVNNSYNYFAKKFLNIDKHWFKIKQELIAKSGFFITKKRYGLQIIDKNGIKVNEIYVKGLDIVRSDFPPAFRKILSKVLEDILEYIPKDQVNNRIVEFQKTLKLLDINEIAKPTGVNGISKYSKNIDNSVFTAFEKRAPIHVKSAISYNDLLNYYGLQKIYSYILNGDKIKWVYLKENPFHLDTIAFRGYEDPKEILDFIRKYINLNKIYKKSLLQKIKMFYESLNWDLPSLEQKKINKFFV